MALEEPLETPSSFIFTHSFWGEKHTGFDVLNQNLKLACRSTSDFIDFLRECCAVDDSYHKALAKLAKQTASYQTISSFKPCWTVIRNLMEQLSQLQICLLQNRQNLMKDVQKYLEEQQKQNKSIKESESSTQELVHAFQSTCVQLQKAKVCYHTRHMEYQRVMRNESSSVRDQEKAATKLKKAEHEYKYLVEKYNNMRNDFVDRMHASCIQFQNVELTHLERMCEFLSRCGALWSESRESLDNVYKEFSADLSQLTPKHLLEVFVKERGTGRQVPPEVSFEDAEVASVFFTMDKAAPSADHSSSSTLGKDLQTSLGSASCVRGSEVSLNDLGDSASANSLPVNGSVSSATGASSLQPATKSSFGSRRRPFGRHKSSPHEPSPDAPAATNTPPESLNVSTRRSANSLSAFNLVAKFGSRHLGSFAANRRDKANRTQVDDQGPRDWQNAIPPELPKDEEGFSIPPADPWASEPDGTHSDSDHSGSDEDVDVLGRSFKGLKVNIRPVGQLAPGVSTLSPDGTDKTRRWPNSNRALMPVLSDHRGGKTHRLLPTGTNLIQQLPPPPALPPPPGSDTGVKEVCLSPRQNRRRVTTQFEPKCRPPSQTEVTEELRTSSDAVQTTSVVDDTNKWALVPVSLPSTDKAFSNSFVNNLESKTGSPSNWLFFGAGSSGSKNDTVSPTRDAWPASPPPPVQEPVRSESSPLTHSRPPSSVSSNPPASIQPSSSPSFSVEDHTSPTRHLTVPVAAAFVETWQARFLNGGGSSFSTKATITPPPKHSVSGYLTLAFPNSVIQSLTTAAEETVCGDALVLRLQNAMRLKNIRLQLDGSTINERPVAQLSGGSSVDLTGDCVITIPGSVLTQHLTKQLTQMLESSPSYRRLNVLSYDVDLNEGPSHHSLSPPINLCTYWRCEPDVTDFRLDYTTNWPKDNFASSREAKGELHISMNVDGGVNRMQSHPVGIWEAKTNQAMWKIPLSFAANSANPQSPSSSGTVRAKFALSSGPGRPQSVNLRFAREDCLASGLHLVLESTTHYRLSLCKRRIIGDHYICDPPVQSSRFQLHPTVRSPSALPSGQTPQLSLSAPPVSSSQQKSLWD